MIPKFIAVTSDPTLTWQKSTYTLILLPMKIALLTLSTSLLFAGCASQPGKIGSGKSNFPALMNFKPTSKTPQAVSEQFGRLVGVWNCTSESLGEDGEFQSVPGNSRWTFFYTLDGQGIGDVFEPSPESIESGAAVGINLRVYDPDRDTWVLSWTTPVMRRFDYFEAKQEEEDLIMWGEIRATISTPQHSAKITFSEISQDGFEWKYEAGAPGFAGPWQEFSRIHCKAS